MKSGLLPVMIMIITEVYAADLINTVPVEKDVRETITSLNQIEQIVRDTQKQFWQLIPPMDDPLYIHPECIVRAVDWKSKEWPKTVIKQMYAEMETAGLSRSMYPFYKLTVVEARSGEMIYYNSYDQEVWRTPAPIGYNEYLFAFKCYGVDSLGDLTDQQKIFGRSSNVGTEILLLPEVFMDSYEEDVAMESRAITELSASMSLMLAPLSMDSGIELQGCINSVSNGTVEVLVEWLSSLDSNSLDLFLCTDLVAANWQLETNFPTASSTNFYFTDIETILNQRFYVVGTDYDEDGDGLANAHERYLYKTREDLFSTDGDGLGDGWEILYGFNPFSIAGNDGALGDVDNDGYSNLEEQTKETDPLDSFEPSQSSTGTVATLRYYYDKDDRLTDFYGGVEVAQKTILTASHNIAEEISAK